MNAILLIGLQASGKSTFYERNFASTHLRISRDLLNTKSREQHLIQVCLASKRDFVIDNTNATIAHRAPYIELAKAAGFRVIGYFFVPDVKACLDRNSRRTGPARIPVPGIYRTNKVIQPPTYAEGFDNLYEVALISEDFRVLELPRH